MDFFAFLVQMLNKFKAIDIQMAKVRIKLWKNYFMLELNWLKKIFYTV